MTRLDKEYLEKYLWGRGKETHKHEFGHALLVCGCETMPGAAVLATGAALKSGCGLVTLHSTRIASVAAMCQFPSAMLSIDPLDAFSSVPACLDKFTCIGVGPGLGMRPATVDAFAELLRKAGTIPMVLDADALNIIASEPDLLDIVPPGSVMTPHLGELRRLIPSWTEDGDELISRFCMEHGTVLVKKGYHTHVFTPDGEVLENTTGNPGMAKGGSGDVLTGLITGLVARGYDPLTAACLGVWIHGYAGDCLTGECTAEAYNSRDLIDYIYKGFKAL